MSGQPRSIALVEVSDQRTAAWGYAGSQILKHLAARGYHWFEACEGGWLRPAPLATGQYDRNFVAVPDGEIERVREYRAPAQDVAHQEPGMSKQNSTA